MCYDEQKKRKNKSGGNNAEQSKLLSFVKNQEKDNLEKIKNIESKIDNISNKLSENSEENKNSQKIIDNICNIQMEILDKL